MQRALPGISLFLLLFVACASSPDSSSGSSGGQAGGKGGKSGNGGTSTSGGSVSSGGTSGSGGSVGSGGTSGGGGSATGGASDAGGSSGSGGSIASGGTGGGGSSASGGASSRGGNAGSGGLGGVGSGGFGGGGGAASGGQTGTGGATYSTEPTACTFPSAWNPGSPTYTTYSLPNPATACGYTGSNNNISNIAVGSNYAAIPGKSPSDFDTKNRCGACVQVGNAIVTIVDECPYDPGSNNQPCANNPTGHLDLSTSAAGAAGVKGDPALRNQAPWKFVPCPVKGNVVVRLKNGNNNEIYIENMILPIQSVNCAGQTASRTSYGAWHFNSNVPGASCEVTDIAGRTIPVTVGSTQGQNVDSGKQFPKCL